MLIRTPAQSTVREVTVKDLHKLANLIHFESYVHRHLDYRPPLDWFGKTPFLVLEKNKSIVATLACPADPPHVAWIRLYAATTGQHASDHWTELWAAAKAQLRDLRTPRWAAAIPMQRWFEDLLTQSGYEQTHRIVMLNWQAGDLPPVPDANGFNIRPMSLDDLEAVQRIDEAAFPPIWRHSLAYLELAFRQAALATVAEREGYLVGYQVSTPTPMGGHLARLAVDPKLQQQGIGRGLLHDLLKQFHRRGARAVTVNTQENNAASLALYRRMGFVLSSEEYPVYQVELK